MENASVLHPPAVAGPSWVQRMRAGARACVATNLRTAVTIGVGALALRVIWVLAVQRRGFVINDALFYTIFASQLADGHGFTNLDGTVSAAWPPAWPFVLAGPFKVFGHDAIVGELTNALIGAVSVPLLYYVALRAFGRREAIFCAVVMAVMPSQVYLTDVLLTETFFVFLLIALLAATTALAPTTRNAALIGVLVGVAGLTRGEGLLLAVIPLAAWSAHLDLRTWARRGAVLAGCAVLAIMPWTIRNQVRLHAFVLDSTNGGQTLWSGHNPRADGGRAYPSAKVVARYEAMGKPAGELALDRELKHEAISWALAHPQDELLLIPKRLLALIDPDSQAFGLWINPQPSGRPVISSHKTYRLSVIADAAWFALLGTFLVAVAIYRRALWRASAPIMRGVAAWFGVSLVLYGAVFFGQFRYHIPLEPLMMLTIAPMACALWASRRRLAQQLVAGQES